MSVNTLYVGDFSQVVEQERLTADCVFVDPPDNLGLKYPDFDDHMTEEDYEHFLFKMLRVATAIAPIVWVSFYSQYAAMMGHLIHKHFRHLDFKPLVQAYTFGQHNQKDFGRNHRPLWRLSLPGVEFYPDAIRVESWRQRNGDKRADPRGRVPGDVQDFQYPFDVDDMLHQIGDFASKYYLPDKVRQELAELLLVVHPGDVLDFPRVTGNSKQRCDWFPTQLHEEMIERILKFSTREGQHVVDFCAGTGTVGRVCKKINRDCTMIEISPEHARKIVYSLPTGTNMEYVTKEGRHPYVRW